jgi:hypothetical protein
MTIHSGVPLLHGEPHFQTNWKPMTVIEPRSNKCCQIA